MQNKRYLKITGNNHPFCGVTYNEFYEIINEDKKAFYFFNDNGSKQQISKRKFTDDIEYWEWNGKRYGRKEIPNKKEVDIMKHKSKSDWVNTDYTQSLISTIHMAKYHLNQILDEIKTSLEKNLSLELGKTEVKIINREVDLEFVISSYKDGKIRGYMVINYYIEKDVYVIKTIDSYSFKAIPLIEKELKEAVDALYITETTCIKEEHLGKLK